MISRNQLMRQKPVQIHFSKNKSRNLKHVIRTSLTKVTTKTLCRKKNPPKEEKEGGSKKPKLEISSNASMNTEKRCWLSCMISKFLSTTTLSKEILGWLRYNKKSPAPSEVRMELFLSAVSEATSQRSEKTLSMPLMLLGTLLKAAHSCPPHKVLDRALSLFCLLYRTKDVLGNFLLTCPLALIEIAN